MVAVAAVKDDRKAPAAPKYSHSALVSHFKLVETERNTFEILVDDDTPQEILLRDEYWTLVSEQLTNRDLIYVSPKNGRWLCILRVIFADRKTRQAQVALLQKWDLPAPKTSLNFGLPPGAGGIISARITEGK